MLNKKITEEAEKWKYGSKEGQMKLNQSNAAELRPTSATETFFSL